MRERAFAHQGLCIQSCAPNAGEILIKYHVCNPTVTIMRKVSSQYQCTPSSIIAKYLISGHKQADTKEILPYTTALFPHFSYKFLGVLPRLTKETYYYFTSVQVFIIYPGGENHRQPLYGRFLRQQSTFLPILPAAPDNISFRLSTNFSSSMSHYMHTPMSAPVSDSTGPGCHLMQGKLQLPAS